MHGFCCSPCHAGLFPALLAGTGIGRPAAPDLVANNGGNASLPPPPAPLVWAQDGSRANVAGDVGGGVLSRRQQKKQVLRDARQQRKGQKKTQKQADACGAALTALGAALPQPFAVPGSAAPEAGTALAPAAAEALRDRVCRAFGASPRYQQLPLAYGPTPTVGLAALGSALVRPPKYSAKFLPQEYSLLHKVWCLLGGDCERAGVIDVGAGNANCAVLAAALLGLTVVCVERESPRVELRAEAQLPPHLQERVVRLESDVEDFDASALKNAAGAYGLDRLVLLAKHPCGIGVDRTIDCAARLCASARCAGATGAEVAESLAAGIAAPAAVGVVGVIIATCCMNKLCHDDLKESRVAEFCAFYRRRLCDASAGCNGEALAVQPVGAAVEVMSRCSAWRTASGSLGNAIQPEQREWAELFEDALQAPRLRRLHNIFGAAEEVRFAPHECTLQDRCLLAGTPPLPAGLFAHGDGCEDAAFLARLRTGAAGLTTPIDCRPKGLKSARYDFDYTDIGVGSGDGEEERDWG